MFREMLKPGGILSWLKAKLFGPRSTAFRDSPWLYSGQYIVLYGRITRVFYDRWQLKLKFACYRKLQALFPKSKIKFRAEHQRFIVTSPLIKKHEGIFVSHNVNFGHQPIAVGKWVKVCGQYIHRPGFRRGVWGLRATHYGLIHSTHEPIGFLRILDQEPELNDTVQVQVLTKDQINRLYAKKAGDPYGN